MAQKNVIKPKNAKSKIGQSLPKTKTKANDTKADALEKTKIAWHPAFCSAAEFDLRAEHDKLVFEPEHYLSREPLRMDLLIIKKQDGVTIDNDIARIFRKYNVIEYKSPQDGVNIDSFYKTIAYACLYKALAEKVDVIPVNEITVSIFQEKHPRKLLQTLTDNGETIENNIPGVYTLNDFKPFPVQIVVTQELKSAQHAALRILSQNAQTSDIETFIHQAEIELSQGEQLNVNAILKVSITANQQAYNDLKRRNPNMCDAVRILFKDEIEAGIEQVRAESEAKGRAEGRVEGEAKGRAEGEAKGRAEGEAKGRAEGEAKGRAEGEAKGRAEGEAKGRAEGEAKGRAEGEDKKALQVAENMLKNSEPVSKIHAYTELTVKRIQEIAAKIGVAVVM